jgi:hypothetical protein
VFWELFMKLVLALVFLCGAAWGQSTPGYTTGSDLRENCGAALDKQTQSGARAGLCAGFIDAYRQLSIMVPAANLKLCLPAGVEGMQLIKVIVRYLDQHPERLHLPAAQLIYDATNDAFPCPVATK